MDEYMKLVRKVAQSSTQVTLYSDMDENQNLYDLAPFVMTDFSGKAIPRVTNVTLPAIATFGDRVINITGGVLPLINIKSKTMLDDAKDKAKYFLYGAFDSANSARAKRGLPSFNAKLAEYGALKRVIALRVIVKADGDKTAFDLMPMDPRNMVYRMGKNGPLFVAYRTVRDAESIFDEYGKIIKKDEGTIWEYWDDNVHRIYFSADTSTGAYDGELISGEENVLGYIPAVIIPLERTIFHNCKQTYLQMCRTASILKSQSMDTLFGPKEFHTPGGAESPEEIPGTGDFVTVGVDPNEGWKNIPLNDVYQATAFMWQIETSEFQRASYAFIEYGGLEFPMSSLALSELKEGRDEILFPLINGMGLCYRETCDMLIKQFKAGPYVALLGQDDHIMEYQASDLPEPGKDCHITFSFRATNAMEQGAMYQMAMAAEPYLPRKMILEDILKVDNAERILSDMLMQEAENSFPELKIPKMIEAFEKAGKEHEAALLKQILEGAGQEEENQGPPQPVQQQAERVMPPPQANPKPAMVTAPAPTGG